KFAMEGFSETLRLEMLPFGVHVALVEPGAYRTSIWSKGLHRIAVRESSPYADMLRRVLDYTRRSAERSGDPQEVADTIVRIAQHPYPKLRYVLGKGTRLTLLAKALLPWKVLEAAVLRMLSAK